MGKDPGNAPPEAWSEEMPPEELERDRQLLRQSLRGGEEDGSSGSGDSGGDGRLDRPGR